MPGPIMGVSPGGVKIGMTTCWPGAWVPTVASTTRTRRHQGGPAWSAAKREADGDQHVARSEQPLPVPLHVDVSGYGVVPRTFLVPDRREADARYLLQPVRAPGAGRHQVLHGDDHPHAGGRGRHAGGRARTRLSLVSDHRAGGGGGAAPAVHLL